MKLAVVISVVVSSCGAQTGPNVVGSGYANPLALYFTPNQITTIFVSGVKHQVPLVTQASTFPLPTTLAGFSVMLQERSDSAPTPVPIFAVRRLTDAVAAITVQIPKITVAIPAAPPDPKVVEQLVIYENGVAGPPIAYGAVFDQIHVLTDCEPYPTGERICHSMVTRPDGRRVVGAVHSGEVLVVYVAGLGVTSSSIPGQPSPPGTAIQGVDLTFDFSINAPPKHGSPGELLAGALFAGLTPGLAGVYQVNFKVPDLPPGTPECPGSLPGVRSNLTVNLDGFNSFDGFPLCVQP